MELPKHLMGRKISGLFQDLWMPLERVLFIQMKLGSKSQKAWDGLVEQRKTRRLSLKIILVICRGER